ncbi:MAG: 1-acyl-sn-glycerol-3-phosphate acyltransferase [Pirellulales bacterium]|nr:1-acyl-sn-glycerol-3-phosphate acyltransferase [Pirellulales bacterium]
MSHLPFIDGTYRTVPRPISWLARKFPEIVFYAKATAIVFRAAWKAKRSRYDGAAWTQSSLEVLQALESVGVEFEITGIEQFEQLDEPFLVVGNHMSTLETMVLPCVIQPFHEVTFVIKESLLKYPIFKHVMRSRDPIPVTQKNVRHDFKAMLTGGLKRLKQGVSLIVFPEGERTPVFDPEQFNSIGVKLASRADVPIVPLALETGAWGLGKIIGDVGKIDPTKKVRFAFGTPLRVEGRGDNQQQALIDFIREKLATWNSTCESALVDQSALVDVPS